MRDTGTIVPRLHLESSKTKLLAIVANKRGALEAAQFDEISYLGYPFSISETFQIRNTNATIAESLERVKVIQEICVNSNKTLVIYISMGFGNPYGDDWNVEVVQGWVKTLTSLGIKIIQLSDTVGVAQSDSISYLFKNLIPNNPDIEIGAHFHTTPATWLDKVHSAYENGCRRFDGTIQGLGGCPMAKDSLVGNMPSEHLIQFAQDHKLDLNLNIEAYHEASKMAQKIMIH